MRAATWCVVAALWAWALCVWGERLEMSQRAAVAAVRESVRR
jgi:hypothetical protein